MSDLAEISRHATFPDLQEELCWSIHLDDTTIIESVGQAVAEELKDEMPEAQARLRRAYSGREFRRIPPSRKAFGAVVDGFDPEGFGPHWTWYLHPWAWSAYPEGTTSLGV